MLVIGLTGNFGTGKSTVSEIMSELGAAIIDADKLGHQLLEPNSPAYQEIVAAFGTTILNADRKIDRHKLGQLAFANASAVTQLNGIMHPKIYQMAKGEIAQYRAHGANVVVLEAALLIEADWTPLVDQVWVTVAPETTILERLKDKTALSEQQILARLRSQMPSEEKANRADIIMDTDCPLDELKVKVSHLWQTLLHPNNV